MLVLAHKHRIKLSFRPAVCETSASFSLLFSLLHVDFSLFVVYHNTCSKQAETTVDGWMVSCRLGHHTHNIYRHSRHAACDLYPKNMQLHTDLLADLSVFCWAASAHLYMERARLFSAPINKPIYSSLMIAIGAKRRNLYLYYNE